MLEFEKDGAAGRGVERAVGERNGAAGGGSALARDPGSGAGRAAAAAAVHGRVQAAGAA
jgi:hypothetical protein